ncbi:hypothetical protein QQF64_013625 [Cirrhinus molitorella]|uniref:Integrase catalytic domain-containing protein n=1 Tax=Cirrhinus molitorella TaxID=172907 RepID=A0ABR3LUZ3_9TELE
MEELLKCLTEVSVRQQQIVEHIATRQGIELFLQMFHTTAVREGWDRSLWARVLGPLLTGEAQRAYFSLSPESADDYEVLKKEILGRLGLSSISAAQLFHEWEYKPRRPARAQTAELARLTQHWLLEGTPTAGQVAERVIIDRLLRALPPPTRRAVGMTNPTTIAELVESIKLAEAAMHRKPGERAPSFPRRVNQERRTPEGTPAAPGPVDEPMPTEDPVPPARTWLAGCIVHQDPPREAPRTEVKINGRAALALLDSGSSVSLVQAAILPPQKNSKSRLPITCVHGDTRHVPARRVTITAGPGSWPVDVGIVKELPVPVLLGRDWLGFEQLLRATNQPASRAGSRHERRAGRKTRRPALLASDSGRDGESPTQSTNVFFDVFQQEQQPAPHPLPHFVVKRGLLYCVAQRRGEVKELLVVPKGKVEMVMELAHAHPMAGHLGAANTAQRIRDYATRYPEAIPLRKATAKNIAQELFLLCTRVGIPAETLTDQGTPFMSRLMADLCRLLRVKQIRTTVFHPQTDGLVERFNQTLKQMLKCVAAEDRKDWDLILPYVLFGIWEVPQASTGFTPFELLFGRQPRGLLDVAREAWKQQQPAPLRSAVEHVGEMREQIERVMPLVKEHLTKAQQSQQ